jgi:hypothetical protein
MSVVKSKDETEFIVLKIHKTKKEGCKKLYLVEWDGYPSENDYSWEPYKNLKNCIIFQDYIKSSGSKRKREDAGILVKDIFKKTKRESLTKDERFELIRCQNYKCNLCLNPFGSSSFEVDHIVPLEQGGTNDLINLQGLCNNCHIFKTTVLDRGVIARLLQAKLQNTKVSGKSDLSFTRKEILEECQMIYFNRNMTKLPFHQDEMLNFCITTVDIYREMCKKEVKKRINNIIKDNIIKNNMTESKIDIKIKEVEPLSNTVDNPIKPPAPLEMETIIKTPEKSEYLINLVNLIKNLILFDIQSNVIYMKNFTLTIVIEGIMNKDDTNYLDCLYDGLNMFFKNIYKTKPEKLETSIGNIKITYTKI